MSRATQSSKVCITLIYYWRTCWRGRNASQRVSVVPQVHLLPVALVSPSWPSQSFLATSNAHTAQTQKAPGVCVVCPSIQGHPLEIVKATPSRPWLERCLRVLRAQESRIRSISGSKCFQSRTLAHCSDIQTYEGQKDTLPYFRTGHRTVAMSWYEHAATFQRLRKPSPQDKFRVS